MPAGNGTGPMGAGPVTGRGAGFCGGYATAGYANPVAGGGRGRGMGFRQGYGGHVGGGMGMGFRRGRQWGGGYGMSTMGAPPAPMVEQEASLLKTQAQHLESTLADIHKRLVELEAGK